MRAKPKPKPKPTRNTFTPALLVNQLAKDVPGFKSETPQVQAALASLVWIGATKLRQHAVHDGYMSFHHTELAVLFGGQFKAINERLDFLDVKDTWRWSADGKATDVFTKGYRFSPVVQASREAFLAKKVARARLSRLLDATGTGFRTAPKAVASTDMAGAPTSRWRAANVSDSLSLVAVDVEALEFLRRDLRQKITTWRRVGHAPRDLWMDYPSLDYLLDLHDKTAQIIRMGHTDVAGLGCVQTATGYALKLEEKLVRPDLAEQFGKAIQHEFSKVRNSRKASNGAGFGHIHPAQKAVNSAGAS